MMSGAMLAVAAGLAVAGTILHSSPGAATGRRSAAGLPPRAVETLPVTDTWPPPTRRPGWLRWLLVSAVLFPVLLLAPAALLGGAFNALSSDEPRPPVPSWMSVCFRDLYTQRMDGTTHVVPLRLDQDGTGFPLKNFDLASVSAGGADCSASISRGDPVTPNMPGGVLLTLPGGVDLYAAHGSRVIQRLTDRNSQRDVEMVAWDWAGDAASAETQLRDGFGPNATFRTLQPGLDDVGLQTAYGHIAATLRLTDEKNGRSHIVLASTTLPNPSKS